MEVLVSLVAEGAEAAALTCLVPVVDHARHHLASSVSLLPPPQLSPENQLARTHPLAEHEARNPAAEDAFGHYV